MDPKHKDILRTNRPKIEDDLEVNDVWAHLIAYQVFVPADYEEFFNPNRKPMATLLDKLEKKGHKAFKLFVKAVSESGKAHLLDCLSDKEPSQIENEEPQTQNDELVGGNTEFQDEQDFNDSDPPRSCTGECTETIRRLQEMLQVSKKENAQLKTTVNICHNNMAIQNDYLRATETTICILQEKNRMLMEQNEHLYKGQNLLYYQNRQLMGGNTSLPNELQQPKLTRKRGSKHAANDSENPKNRKKDHIERKNNINN